MPKTFTTDRGDRTLRLDQIVVRHLTDVPRLSRTKVQRWISQRLVVVNGHVATRASAPIAGHARIEVSGDEAMAERALPQAEHQTLDILYEDPVLLALNKPAGIVVHPSYKHAAGTLFNGVLGYLGGDHAPADAPRLLHRLDKDTSGVILISKSIAAHRTAQRTMTSGHASKQYLAVVHGSPRPGRGSITMPLGADLGDRRRMAVCTDGSPSHTDYEVLSRGSSMSVIRCELRTGRMHQIRVHLSTRGWPIVGDHLYGAPGDPFPRQALHAWRLRLPHPVTGHPLDLSAPVPEDIAALCDRLAPAWREQ